MTVLFAIAITAIASMFMLRGIMTRGPQRRTDRRRAFGSDSSTSTTYDSGYIADSGSPSIDYADPTLSCGDMSSDSGASGGDCGSGDSGGGGSSD